MPHSKMGAKSPANKGAKQSSPKSRWPKEAEGWSGKQRSEHAAKLLKQHPKEDPEYGMPD